MNREIRMEEKLIKQMSPTALSFMGDSVFELYVRLLVLEKGSRTADKLNRDKVKIVNAKAQAQLAIRIEELLTEEEHDIYRRGKNARQRSVAKNQSVADYHKASGLEALLGYLYLKGEDERIRTLLQAGLRDDEGSHQE